MNMEDLCYKIEFTTMSGINKKIVVIERSYLLLLYNTLKQAIDIRTIDILNATSGEILLTWECGKIIYKNIDWVDD